MTDRTPDQTKPDHDRMTIAEAAKRLGVSTDAIRKRLNRGQLHGEKVGGVWVVFLPAETSQSRQFVAFDRTGPDDRDRLIAALESDVEFLRRELDTRNDEIERRDILLRQALGLVPALPAVTSHPDHPTDSSDGQGDAIAADATSDTSRLRARPWWRRWFG